MPAPANASPAHAFVGPDGALAQAGEQPAAVTAPATATPAQSFEEQKPAEQPVLRREEVGNAAAATGAMAVDPQGQSQPVAGAARTGAALMASGEAAQQHPQEYPYYQYHAPSATPPRYAPYPTPVVSSAAAPVHTAPQASSGTPVIQAGLPCDIPMWGKDKYACAEFTEFKYSKDAWTDMAGNVRLRMPDESVCTVLPPACWMDTAVKEMYCNSGTWMEGGPAGKQVLEIDCTTAVWFYVASGTSLVGVVVLIYKLKYDTGSALRRWWHKTGDAPLLEGQDAGFAEPTGEEAQQPTQS